MSQICCEMGATLTTEFAFICKELDRYIAPRAQLKSRGWGGRRQLSCSFSVSWSPGLIPAPPPQSRPIPLPPGLNTRLTPTSPPAPPPPLPPPPPPPQSP